MAHNSKYNSVGAGSKPELGCCPPEGLARPGGFGQSAAGITAGDIPKVARPGGAQRIPKPAGSPLKAARPGGTQSANKNR